MSKTSPTSVDLTLFTHPPSLNFLAGGSLIVDGQLLYSPGGRGVGLEPLHGGRAVTCVDGLDHA